MIRTGRSPASKRLMLAALTVLAAVLVIALRIRGLPSEPTPSNSKVTGSDLIPETNITHGHGLAVDRDDGDKLYIATHHGLLVLRDEKDLFRIGRSQDDYMGFSPHPTESGLFYSSGHPSSGGNIGFQKSEDGGATWQKVSDGMNGPVDFHAMAVSPANPDIVYGWYRGDLQRSLDGGRTWKVFPTGFVVVSLAADPKDENVVYAATPQGQGILVSKNQGVDWSPLSGSLGGGAVSTVAVDPNDPQHLLTSSEMIGRAYSLDGGATWQAMSGSFDGMALFYAFDPKRIGRVYALTHTNALYKSEDGGASWLLIR